MSLGRRISLIVPVALVVLLCLTAPAVAATLTQDGSTLTYSGEDGVDNLRLESVDANTLRIHDLRGIDTTVTPLVNNAPACVLEFIYSNGDGDYLCTGQTWTKFVANLGNGADGYFAEKTSATLSSVVDAGSGLDGVRTGPGNDVINTGVGPDGEHFVAGAGDDRITVGQSRNLGFGYARIFAGAGNDVIDVRPSGKRANPFVSGDAGNDTIIGGVANTTADLGAGNDVFRGGTGNEVAHGVAGNDVLNGNSGNDNLTGGLGNNRLNAGAGNDYITLGGTTNVATGGPGNDNIVAGKGNDTINGGAGSDAMSGGAGRNRITCDNSGTDRVNANDGDTIINQARCKFVHWTTNALG